MKINTVRQRLALYKKALKDYKAPHPKCGTSTGFCRYFSNVHKLSYGYLHQDLPELSKGRPQDGYWFKKYGVTKARIKALEKAIQRCEEQLKS